MTERLDPGMERAAAREDVRSLLSWRPISLDAAVLQGAWAVQDRYRFILLDGLIVSAAQGRGCRYLRTEDLQVGQDLHGVRVVDPIHRAPGTNLG